MPVWMQTAVVVVLAAIQAARWLLEWGEGRLQEQRDIRQRVDGGPSIASEIARLHERLSAVARQDRQETQRWVDALATLDQRTTAEFADCDARLTRVSERLQEIEKTVAVLETQRQQSLALRLEDVLQLLDRRRALEPRQSGERRHDIDERQP